ncbi:DnaD domain protein [Paenibacillus sp. FSL R5-0928]
MLPEIFDMLLFTWMIPHADDYGRLPGSPAKIKALVVPMLDRSLLQVKQSLERLEEQKLILWYEAGGDKLIQIIDNEKHQQGLKGKKAKYSAPDSQITSNDGYLSASEKDIEEIIIQMLYSGSFFNEDVIISVENQLRVENSYIDILATGESARRYLFEVKRQRLSNASIDQIVKYRDMLGGPPAACLLIGNGLSSNFDLKKCEEEQINVLIYDDLLNVDCKMLFNVKCRYPLLLSNRTELNRTELNRSRTEQEQNGTEPIIEASLDSGEDEILFGSGPLPSVPDAYRMFETEGFGTISDVIKDRLNDFIKEYSERWLCEAMKKAVLAGKRSLNYVGGTLKNWRADGIDEPWTKESQPASGGGYRSGRNGGQSGKQQIEITKNDLTPPTPEEIALQEKMMAKLKAKKEAEEKERQEKRDRGEGLNH